MYLPTGDKRMVITPQLALRVAILGGVALGLGISAKNAARRLGGLGSSKATAGIVLGGLAIFLGIVVFIANVSAMS